MRLAVIGGGWAGLAAAVELTAGSADVTLYEAGRVLGGRARSVSINGQTLDNGQHILLGAYRDTLDLMRQVGADPDALFDRIPLQVVDRSGFRLALPRLPAPLNVAWGLLWAKNVSWPEKLQTALWMQGIKFRQFQLKKDCSVADWLDAAGQTGSLRRHLWEPLCLAALNTPAERASAQLFANVLRDSLGSSRRADTDLLLPRTDFARLLPTPAGEWLTAQGASLQFGHRVAAITPTPGGVEIDGAAFAGAVLAVAPQHAAALWPEITANFDYEPIATVYLKFSPKSKFPFPLLNLLGESGQWAIDRGDGLISCVISGHGDWEKLDDPALAAALEKELAMAESAEWRKVIREKRATFSARPGLSRPSCTTSHRQLLVAGDYTWADYPATLEGAVRSGRRAARQLLASSCRGSAAG